MSTAAHPRHVEDHSSPAVGDASQSTRAVTSTTSLWKRSSASWQSRHGSLLILLGMGVAGVFAVRAGFGVGSSDTNLVYHTVRRADLSIIVTERGNLESQQDIQILCETDDIRSEGVRGTLIVWIVPNGSSVRRLDEFRYESLRDYRLDR